MENGNGATVRTSEAINYTIGRATNDDLEATVAVWFKDEDEVEGVTVGPVWLQVGGAAPDDENPLGGSDRQLVAFGKGDSTEWHTVVLAETLAEEMGVPLVRS